MIPYDVDPSLHSGEPAPARFDDGFSPPAPEPASAAQTVPAGSSSSAPARPIDAALWAKSAF